jgi:hypothetical protein
MSPDMNAPPVPWKNTGAKPVVQVDAQKHPTSIALVIPAVLIDTLPKKRSEAVYPVQGGGLVQTANLQWHPMGHEPEHVYDTPHFDVHFYTITESVRGSIVPNAPAGKVMPYKGTLPRGVILAPGYVPGMGMHAIPHEPVFGVADHRVLERRSGVLRGDVHQRLAREQGRQNRRVSATRVGQAARILPDEV